MNYCSNIFSDFEFHDSEFTFLSWHNNVLSVQVKYMNIHKEAAGKNFNADMEIELAQIIFEDFKILSFTPSRTWKRDADGNSYTEEPLVLFQDEAAVQKLKCELECGINVYDFYEEEGIYTLCASGIDPYFTAKMSFHSVNISWDDYRKVAWYEERKLQKSGD